MSAIEILGLCAAVLITLANVPQLMKILKTRSVKDISIRTYVLLVAGNACWLVYGILKSDLPILIGNAVSTLICVAILICRVIWKNKDK